jgi:hypothetical protein
LDPNEQHIINHEEAHVESDSGREERGRMYLGYLAELVVDGVEEGA